MEYKTIKTQLHKMIDKVDDPEVLYAFRGLLNKNDSSDYLDEFPDEKLTDWQIKRLNKSHQQLAEGKYFTNEQADMLVEKWLSE
jgi:type IV secretory pathway component VirB8